MSAAGPLFLTPLRIEALAASLARPRPAIVRIGMGPVAATAAMARLSRTLAAPRPIVVLGCAGALVPGLRAGDVVVARALSGIDADESLPLAEADGIVRHLERAGIAARLGDVVSVPRILSGDAARERAGANGALVCDMESLWLAPLARRHPFAVVRAVVDGVGADLVSFATPRAAARAFASVRNAARALADWVPDSVSNYPLVEAGEP